MDPREQALLILQQARDALAERLAQRILESRQEILDDADGQSYLSEIEAIYDQLGGRLAHVNSMLAHLPPVEAARASEVPLGEPIIAEMSSGYPESFTSMEPYSALLALPPPEPTIDPAPVPSPITFHTFAELVQSGDIDAAGRALVELLAIDVARARQCTEEFCRRLPERPNLLWQVVQLRSNCAHAVLSEAFGLQGEELRLATEALRARCGESS